MRLLLSKLYCYVNKSITIVCLRPYLLLERGFLVHVLEVEGMLWVAVVVAPLLEDIHQMSNKWQLNLARTTRRGERRAWKWLAMSKARWL